MAHPHARRRAAFLPRLQTNDPAWPPHLPRHLVNLRKPLLVDVGPRVDQPAARLVLNLEKRFELREEIPSGSLLNECGKPFHHASGSIQTLLPSPSNA